MTNLRIINKPYNSKKLEKILSRLDRYKYSILLFGLFIWILIPILGVFPLLFFIQLSILKPSVKTTKFLNAFVLLCILVTLSIFNSSFKPFSDTLVYIQAYSELGNKSIFDVAISLHKNNDFILYLIAYPIYLLSNSSSYWFLFINTLIINSLTIIVSKKVSPKYYPIILILTFSSTFFVTQNFLMRQFLSNIFLLFALAYINDKLIFLFIFGLFASAFSHSSNIFLVLILLTIRFQPHITKMLYASLSFSKKEIKRFNTRIFVLTLFFLVFVSIVFAVLTIVYSSATFSTISGFFASNASRIGIDVSRLDSYSGYSNEEGIPNITISIIESITILFLVLFYFTPIKGKYNNFSDFGFLVVLLYNIFGFLLTFFAGFVWRTSFLFISLSGIFYKLILDRQKERESIYFLFLLLFLIILKISNFFRFLYFANSNSMFRFFDGDPLQKNIFDYFNYLYSILSLN